MGTKRTYRKRKTKATKRRGKIITAVILVSAVLLAVGVFLDSKKLTVEYDESIDAAIHQKLYNTDQIKSVKNGEIITEKALVDTSHVGTTTVTFQVEDFFRNITTHQYTVHVADREAPVITFQDGLETEEGKKLDLLKGVSAADNSGETVAVQVEGDYNFNKPGDYTLFYVAEDSSGNRAREQFVLHVKRQEKPAVPVIKTEKPSDSKPVEQHFTTAKGFNGVTKNGVTYIGGYLVVNKTYSLPSSYGKALTKETTAHFNQMKSAAAADGLNIFIKSGFRSYNTQKGLYQKYVNRDGVAAADTYSARAGHSEHQSGLAFDVNIVNDSFANTPEAKWLNEHCREYGFILRYPKGKENETGYQYEPWHFRYVGVELAETLYNGGNWITIEDYFGITSRYGE